MHVGETITAATKTLLLIVSALFPIVNPLSGSPLFLALTPYYSRPTRRTLARKVTLHSCWVLIVS